MNTTTLARARARRRRRSTQSLLACALTAAALAAQARQIDPSDPSDPSGALGTQGTRGAPVAINSQRAHVTLATLINAYRAAPGVCAGRRVEALPPLTPRPTLDNLQVSTGALLDQVLARAGYPVEHAEAISVSGAADARAALAVMVPRYCSALLSQNVSAIGVGHNGDSWLVVLAQPAPPSPVFLLPDPAEAGRRILAAVNAARATPRQCGDQAFAPAAPVTWNAALAEAARAHSAEMATLRYFSHQGKDGHTAAERALSAGYHWRLVGENIAAGQETADAAVAGWLSSPGHCANIMNARFTEMGAAYGVGAGGANARIDWTQVFATPR